MFNDLTPTAEQAREIAVHDAHNDLRDNMLAIVYARPDAAKIREVIDQGRAELFVELDTASLMFMVFLRVRKSNPILIMWGDLKNDPAAAALRESLGHAVSATISAEPDDVQQRLVTLKNDGAAYVVQLRELGTVKGFGMHLVHGERVVWSPATATPFDDRLTKLAMH